MYWEIQFNLVKAPSVVVLVEDNGEGMNDAVGRGWARVCLDNPGAIYYNHEVVSYPMPKDWRRDNVS